MTVLVTELKKIAEDKSNPKLQKKMKERIQKGIDEVFKENHGDPSRVLDIIEDIKSWYTEEYLKQQVKIFSDLLANIKYQNPGKLPPIVSEESKAALRQFWRHLLRDQYEQVLSDRLVDSKLVLHPELVKILTPEINEYLLKDEKKKSSHQKLTHEEILVLLTPGVVDVVVNNLFTRILKTVFDQTANMAMDEQDKLNVANIVVNQVHREYRITLAKDIQDKDFLKKGTTNQIKAAIDEELTLESDLEHYVKHFSERGHASKSEIEKFIAKHPEVNISPSVKAKSSSYTQIGKITGHDLGDKILAFYATQYPKGVDKIYAEANRLYLQAKMYVSEGTTVKNIDLAKKKFIYCIKFLSRTNEALAEMILAGMYDPKQQKQQKHIGASDAGKKWDEMIENAKIHAKEEKHQKPVLKKQESADMMTELQKIVRKHS